MKPTSTEMAEVVAYAAAAQRGDVLPVCMRLTAARADAEWSLRTLLVRKVGPACTAAALDRACELMPDAPEPRLLRAGRALAAADETKCPATRRAWLAIAQEDLMVATHLDPMDPTARALLTQLVGSHAWAAHHRCAA